MSNPPGPIRPESTWTKPSDWCPNPENWHATDSDSTELEVTTLVAAFVTALQPELVIETGTAWAQTAQAIGKALQTNGHGHLITHETNPQRVQACRTKLAGLPVTVNHGSSLDWTPTAPIQFAWFDSLIPLRGPEFEHYYPWLEEGAIVGFHDSAPKHPKMQPQIEALEARGFIKPIRLRTPRGVTFAEVQ